MAKVYEFEKEGVELNHIAIAENGLIAFSYGLVNGVEIRHMYDESATVTLPTALPAAVLKFEKERLYIADPGLGIVIYDVAREFPVQLGTYWNDASEIKQL